MLVVPTGLRCLELDFQIQHLYLRIQNLGVTVGRLLVSNKGRQQKESDIKPD